MPDSPLMLRNCFFDFAAEHWFACRTTESGFTGDIGSIEIWLIDWLDYDNQSRGVEWAGKDPS